MTTDLKRSEPWSPEQAMRGMIEETPHWTVYNISGMVIEWEKWKQVEEVMLIGRKVHKRSEPFW